VNRKVVISVNEHIQKTQLRTELKRIRGFFAYILRQEGLDPVVVDQQIGLALDELVESHVDGRVHVADNWDLNGLELDLLLAATHGLDNLSTALVTTNAVGNMVEMDGGGECARAVVLGTTPALFARVCVLTDLVAGLAVEEAVIAALADDGSWAGQTDRGIGLKLEGLHWHIIWGWG
jgi:hypothetical protein